MNTEIAEEDGVADSGTDMAAESDKPHSVVVHLLIALAALIMLVTAANVWVDRAALNTDNWVDASDQLLADPTIREAISVYVVDQLYTNVDVSAQLGGLLPGDLSGLSGALASALRNPATDAVDRLLATDQARHHLDGRQPHHPPDDRQHPRGRHEGRSALDLQRERHTRRP